MHSFTVYDILHHFFQHEDKWIALAAYEVYIRRAYRAYDLIDVEYEEGDLADDDPVALRWSFRMQKKTNSTPSASPRAHTRGLRGHAVMPSVDKLSLLATDVEPSRQGVMFASKSIGSLESDLRKSLAYLPSTGATPSAVAGEAVNVCNVALLVYEAKDDRPDEQWQRFLCDLSSRLSNDLESRGVRRITYSICRRGQYPSYFTVRKGDQAWEESSTIRDIEPALAYQLELDRLSNFKITPVGVENHQIHTYYGVAKTNPTDCRFFIRTIVRPNKLGRGGGMREVDYVVRLFSRLLARLAMLMRRRSLKLIVRSALFCERPKMTPAHRSRQ